MKNWRHKHGLDFRFVTFVIITMLGSLILGSFANGLFIVLQGGSYEQLQHLPMVLLFGTFFAIPIVFIKTIIPSAIIFWISMSLSKKLGSFLLRTRVSGTITTILAGSIIVVRLLNHKGDSIVSSIDTLPLFIYVTAIIISPWTSWRAYRIHPMDDNQNN